MAKKRKNEKFEKIALGDLIKTHPFDYHKVGKLINQVYLLVDIAEAYIVEVDHELTKSGIHLSIDIRNSIERLKAHSRNVVGFIDKNTSLEYAESFGMTSDLLREKIEKHFEALREG